MVEVSCLYLVKLLKKFTLPDLFLEHINNIIILLGFRGPKIRKTVTAVFLYIFDLIFEIIFSMKENIFF